MKTKLNSISLLTILTVIPPIILLISLFSIMSFSIIIPIPIIWLDSNAQIGLLPYIENITIWGTTFNWLYLLGVIIWLMSAVLFITLMLNTISEKLRNLAYFIGIIGIIITNFAFIGDIMIYNIVVYTLFPFTLTVCLGLIGALMGIYVKVSD
ncbi:MAG: hypothetical protein ACTSO9_09295 [Candidatus Helarchaeota archaeon]